MCLYKRIGQIGICAAINEKKKKHTVIFMLEIMCKIYSDILNQRVVLKVLKWYLSDPHMTKGSISISISTLTYLSLSLFRVITYMEDQGLKPKMNKTNQDEIIIVTKTDIFQVI